MVNGRDPELERRLWQRLPDVLIRTTVVFIWIIFEFIRVIIVRGVFGIVLLVTLQPVFFRSAVIALVRLLYCGAVLIVIECLRIIARELGRLFAQRLARSELCLIHGNCGW